jgi:1,4-dihydroxy-2-naphthoate octaprenyltransferase
MAARPELFQRIHPDRGFSHAVVVFVGPDGYPVNVATSFRSVPERGLIELQPVDGEPLGLPEEGDVAVVFSHIRPREGVGYDERRYVSLWGSIRRVNGALEFSPREEQGWDEEAMPFFEYSERSVPRAHRYMARLSREKGRTVRPRLAFGWLFLRATRLPFLTATLVPVLLGVAVAALERDFHLTLAVLTLVGAACVQLGLNVANDVFDMLSGADQANVTPTPFSGGSRVIHYGLVSMRGMALLAAGFYAAAVGIGLFLAVERGFWALLVLGAVGVAISVAYTAPPFRLVHRGVGEIAVGLGFGPVMVLGAYYVQAQRFTAEAAFLSIPVAILVALILYVNEVPDRPGDAAADKRTLPVRLSREAVINGYIGAVAVAFGLIAGGALSGLIARPAIIALATIPLAAKVVRGLRDSYDNPYGLMPAMATNIQLHLFTGLLLFAGYLAASVADRVMDSVPVFLR